MGMRLTQMDWRLQHPSPCLWSWDPLPHAKPTGPNAHRLAMTLAESTFDEFPHSMQYRFTNPSLDATGRPPILTYAEDDL